MVVIIVVLWRRAPFDPGRDDGDDDDGDDIDDDQNFDEELDHECFNKIKGIMVAIIVVLLWRASFESWTKDCDDVEQNLIKNLNKMRLDDNCGHRALYDLKHPNLESEFHWHCNQLCLWK